MNNLAMRFSRFEDTLGRALSLEERKLLTLWDMFLRSEPQEEPDFEGEEFEEGRGPADHEGRFKISFVKGQYEVLFVCPTLMLHPAVLDSAEDVVAFLTQDPVNLDEMLIQQALASAQFGRPGQINQVVQMSEPLLRSMGFEHR